jgi:hypothetical protein
VLTRCSPPPGPLLQVFQGVILATRDRFQTNSKLRPVPGYGGKVTSPEGYLLGLWFHECQRVFADKLVSYEDKGWVDKTIVELLKAEFPAELCKQVNRGCRLSPDGPTRLSLVLGRTIIRYRCTCTAHPA